MEQLPLGVRLRDQATFETFQPGGNLEALQHLEALAEGRAGCSACLSCPELRAGGAGALLGWQGFGLLALDDLDALVGDAAFERALFPVFLDAQERGAALVVAADRAPAALRWSLADLGSRFGGSAVFQLRALEDDDQVAALRARATARGLELPEETARYLQRRLPRDMASLCGVLDALDTASMAAQRRITVPFIREVLGEP